MSGTVSVVIPVLNRASELRRALTSLERQTMPDWECIVVDGPSSVDLRAVVSSFDDPRIRYMRRDDASGPAPARVTAWRMLEGEFVLHLDSDWELYPWALSQGVRYLSETPQVDLAIGLCVRNEDSRLFVRVADSPRVITPRDFRMQEPRPDRVAMVRAAVVDDWLAAPGEYFSFEWVMWTTAELSRNSLAVDEPWVLYHTGGEDRHTMSPKAKQRAVDDAVTFLRERSDLMADQPCRMVDRMLTASFFALVRARRPEAKLAAQALRDRGISPRAALAREIGVRASRKLRRGEDRVFWA